MTRTRVVITAAPGERVKFTTTLEADELRALDDLADVNGRDRAHQIGALIREESARQRRREKR